MVNSSLIKKRINELGYTQKNIAKMLNISSSVLSQKLNNERPVSLIQFKELSKILEIEPKDYDLYFFN